MILIDTANVVAIHQETTGEVLSEHPSLSEIKHLLICPV